MNPKGLFGAIASLIAIQCPVASGEVSSERHAVSGEARQEYFLIRDGGSEPPAAGYKLLLVMPGGDGSAAFNPFVTNMRKHALGEGYLVAQLISIKWTPEQKIIWPTAKAKTAGMKFTTEQFIEAVIGDVEKERKLKLDPEHAYTLSWSSSGPAVDVASLSCAKIKGSFVAMSVFKEASLPSLKRAKGHRYYIYHSPDDKVCPYRLAEEAIEALKAAEAEVKFATYEGGHGWHGNIFGAIRTGVAWLEKR